MNEFDDHQLRQLLHEYTEGQPHAREAIIAFTHTRLEAVARKMLHSRFSRLAAAEQMGDIIQTLLVRLLNNWYQTVTTAEGQPILDPATYLIRISRLMRETFLDLVRKHHGRDGERPGMVMLGLPIHDPTLSIVRLPSEDTYNPEILARHTEFHDAVEALPERQRQVVDLHWYQGYCQAQVSTMIGIGEHGVRKRWIEARLKLIKALGPIEEWPGSQLRLLCIRQSTPLKTDKHTDAVTTLMLKSATVRHAEDNFGIHISVCFATSSIRRPGVGFNL